jgi:molybdate transport system ATP-binding protein
MVAGRRVGDAGVRGAAGVRDVAQEENMNGLRANFTKQFPGGPEIRVDQLQPGQNIAVLFGPSGSGKTTILRCLAGLEKPDAGEICFNDKIWFQKNGNIFAPPQGRNIGFVPQDYALFPHLTVAENIGYGLNHLASPEKKSRVAEALDWLGIAGLAARRPQKLSGGESQRVALARAIARRPQLLLLDEPFSALDMPTRQRLRGELAALLVELHLPAILVTHDRLEAAALGEEIFVLAGGNILQRGLVTEVFNRPASLDVARLVGTDTVLACKLIGVANGLATLATGEACLTAMADQLPPGAKNVHVCIRAEDVILSLDTGSHASSRNRFLATITTLTSEGPLVRIDLDCGFLLKAMLTRQSCEELNLQPGLKVTALIKASQAHII